MDGATPAGDTGGADAGSPRSLHALDALNFCMADVQTGVGPYLAIFLKSTRGFNPAQVGLAVAAGALAQVLVQTPAGAFIDRTRAKRVLVAVAAGLTAVGAAGLVLFRPLWTTVVAQALIGGSGAVFPPAVAALSLGIVGRAALSTRQSRNEAFNHGGNLFAAVLFGAVGFFVAQAGIFWCVVALGVAAAVAVLRIRGGDIDHERARGGDARDGAKAGAANEKNPWAGTANAAAAKGGAPGEASVRALLRDRRVLTFVGAVVLFHAANAAMLPLVGELLGGGAKRTAPLYMSACIAVAQLAMIPIDLYLIHLGPRLRHKPVFLVAFAALVARGVLFALTRNHAALIGIQVLDGVGAGIFGVLNVLVIAELTKGTGRFNLAQGATATAIGLGAAASNAGAGLLAKHAGYPVTFFALAGVGGLGLLLYGWGMPETAPDARAGRDAPAPGGAGAEPADVARDRAGC